MPVEFDAEIAINEVTLQADSDISTPGVGDTSYLSLTEKPQINGVTLVGNKSTEDLNIDHVLVADNLSAHSGTTDTTPYTLRPAPSYAGSVAELRKIVGGTLGWNQMLGSINASSSTSRNHPASKSVSGGKITFTSTEEATARPWYNIYFGSLTIVAGHKYLFLPNVETTKFNASAMHVIIIGSPTIVATETFVFTAEEGGSTTYVSIRSSTSELATATLAVGDTVSMSPVMYDLTQMFGTTIADAIAQMETTTAGSGVAFFRSLFPSAYYPYSAPTLASVQTSARVARGFNQWDEEWEVGGYDTSGAKITDTTRIRAKNPFPILPNTQYRSTVGGYYYEYGADGTFLSRAEHTANTTFTTGSGSCFMTFHTYSSYGTTYKYNITIGFSVPEMLGIYVPYEGKSYPIDDVVLRGIPKLANGQLVYDGDMYLPTGSVTRKYGIVDLGTLTWIKDSGYNYFRAVITGGKNPASGGTADAICSNYVTYTGSLSAFNTSDKMCYVFASNIASTPQVAVIDSAHTSDTTAQFKTAMSGVYLVYPLQTPTTETADPYTETQLAGSTEQFVCDNYIPVGNETFYPEDLTSVVQNLAPLPTTAGTYKLQVTVSGGVPSYSWVAG